jgi:DNA-binding NarL/FixJ family response regulator
LSPRVLLVDDHYPWRRQIRSMLPHGADWHVVGEASDGLEAIKAMALLRPDLILLDVELPALNGLETARRILALDPSAKILFVTAHRSWDIAAAALNTGARGYVLKSHAGDELLPAMHASVNGRRFVSPVLAGRGVNGKARQGAHHHRCHEACFYADDAPLLDHVARFAEAALRAGKAFIIVATEPRRAMFRQQLQADGLDIDAAVRHGRHISLDVADVLSSYLVDGRPDEARFWQAATSLVMRAAQASTGEHPGVAVYGEACGALLRDGQVEVAIRSEHLWDEVVRTFNVDMLCGYPAVIAHHDDQRVLQRVYAEHSAVHTG